MDPIKVVVFGAKGRMGREVISAVSQEPEMQLVGAVDIHVSCDSLTLPDGSRTIPFSSDLDYIINTSRPDVLVDFSIRTAAMPAVRIATAKGVHLVIGTTGFTADELDEIDKLATAHHVGAIVAPNFALGAVLMIHLASIAAKYFDYAEIIELHHNQKADAPSGTSLSTARAMVSSRGKPFSPPMGQHSDSRGGKSEGITIHSVRLPGLLAHQEVLLGASGQTLSIRHDTINRECFMPGVILSIKEVTKRTGLVYGLDEILGL